MGGKEIRTGEFRYEQLLVDALPSEENIQASIELERESLRKLINELPSNDRKNRARFEKHLENVESDYRVGLMKNLTRRTRYLYVISGPAALGGDRFVEFNRIDPGSQKLKPSSILLNRTLGAGHEVHLYVSRSGRTALASDSSASSGSQEPHLLGRLIETLRMLAADPKYSDGFPFESMVTDAKSELLKTEDGYEVYEVTCTLQVPEGPRIHLLCHVDPSRGYITPLVEERNNKNLLVQQWKSEDYFQPAGQTLWYPQLCTYKKKSILLRFRGKEGI